MVVWLSKPMKLVMVMMILAVNFLVTLPMFAAPVTVTVWVGEDYRVDAMRQVVETFNAQRKDVQIEVYLQGYNRDKLITALVGGAGPDIFVGAHYWDPELAVNNLLVDLTPLLEKEGLLAPLKADIYPGLFASGSTYEGRIYSIPLDAQVMMLFHNSELLNARGIGEPPSGWTFDDLWKQLPKLIKIENNVIEIDPLLANHVSHASTFFLSLHHATLFTPDTFQPTGDSPNFREAYRKIKELTQARLMRTGLVELSTNATVDLFVTGKVGYLLTGNFRLPNLVQDPTSAQFTQASPVIRLNASTPPKYYSNTRTLAITRQGGQEVSREVWEAFKFLISADAMNDYAAISGLFATRRSALNHNRYREFLATSPPTWRIGNEIIPYGSGEGITGVPGAEQVQSSVQNPLLTQYLKNEIGLEQLVTLYNQQADEILKPFRK